jgi:hypothetical protein
MSFYKAIRVDGTSHFDRSTLWQPGVPVVVKDAPRDGLPCGRGIHVCDTLLKAVVAQAGPSEYIVVNPIGKPLGADDAKIRYRGATMARKLTPEEQDAAAGFRLWEANHPHNPLLDTPRHAVPPAEAEGLLRAWASVGDSVRASVWASVMTSVGASVRDSVRDSVWASVMTSVWASVGASVWASVGASVGASVRASVWASVWASVGAYIGGLFPGITTWRYVDGADPWRPLLTLWYAGYVPSFDGAKWRLHKGPRAEVVLTLTP